MTIDVVLFELDDKSREIAKSLGFEKVYNVNSSEFKKLKIINGGDDETNRKTVENQNNDILLNPHALRSRDFMHSRNCGLNHVLCKIAAENDVAIGFTLDRIYEPKDMARVKLAVKLCRKYKNKIVVFSFAKDVYSMRAVKDIIAFLNVIGMDSKQANNAMELAEKMI
jgi:RNase P/RNase MRP subunit p30